jgi:hypothetical protein
MTTICHAVVVDVDGQMLDCDCFEGLFMVVVVAIVVVVVVVILMVVIVFVVGRSEFGLK